MILLLLCCVPETGVHSPSGRVQSDWAGRSDCHDLSCPTWRAQKPSERLQRALHVCGHRNSCHFFLACVELHRRGMLCATTQCANSRVTNACDQVTHPRHRKLRRKKKKGSTSVSSVRHFAVRANCVSSHRPLRKSSCFTPFRFLLS